MSNLFQAFAFQMIHVPLTSFSDKTAQVLRKYLLPSKGLYSKLLLRSCYLNMHARCNDEGDDYLRIEYALIIVEFDRLWKLFVW